MQQKKKRKPSGHNENYYTRLGQRFWADELGASSMEREKSWEEGLPIKIEDLWANGQTWCFTKPF